MNINARHMLAFVVTAYSQWLMAGVPPGEYRLEKGRGVEVCEVYEKNLISVKPEPLREAGICPIPLAKDNELSEPNWNGRYIGTPMPVPPGVNLLEKVDDYIWQRGVNPAAYLIESEGKRWRGTAREYEKARASFDANRRRYYDDPSFGDFYAEIDIDNDGVTEPVYYDSRFCFYLGMGSLLFVLTPDYADIDRVKTDRLMVYPPRAKTTPLFHKQPDLRLNPRAAIEPTADALRDARYGVFLYKGQAFITVTGFNPSTLRRRDPTIHVHKLEKEKREEICSYSYAP